MCEHLNISPLMCLPRKRYTIVISLWVLPNRACVSSSTREAVIYGAIRQIRHFASPLQMPAAHLALTTRVHLLHIPSCRQTSTSAMPMGPEPPVTMCAIPSLSDKPLSRTSSLVLVFPPALHVSDILSKFSGHTTNQFVQRVY